ncbi:MAG: tetratricopeptide repeat protein [candidate division KSB1 bacterium]|nr:tetratricopeptide repeat protein [candidate division KSB1 bacterium]MDZ7319396.1 tetratricopeptide repeat protein [candidate division KSB1 bacterium]MDZ7339843.1 tetratricopeptide repeat protein [candidate division KSB1 bacterium]
MKRILPYLLLLLLGTMSVSVWAQELEDNLLQWIESNGLDKLKSYFEKISRKYPDSQITLFIEAYIEPDGERAVHLYEQLVRKYPQSKYADRALLKIAQYYYAVGSYVTARQYLDNLVDQFPGSSIIAEAKYLAACCLIAMNYSNSAETELKELIEKYPSSPFKALAQQELKQARSTPESGSPKKDENVYDQLIEATQVQGRYAVQIGAFSDRDNAQKQKNQYVRLGYPATVTTKYVGDRLLYVVWLGDFETEIQARQFGEDFKSKNGVAYQVVRK